MITLEQKQAVLAALKSRTISAIRENQKYRIPFTIGGTIETITGVNQVDPMDSYYAIIPKNGIIPKMKEHEYSYTTLKELEYNNYIWGGIILNRNDDQAVFDRASLDDTPVSEYSSIVTYGTKRVEFRPQRKFHYDDKWYFYKYSADEPEYNFGIVQVDNMPYKTFEGRRNMKSFVCSLNDLFYKGYCEPFLFFVNRKFVNWNDITVVFDCDDTYFLLYGDKYNWFDLRDSEFHMVILPFKCDYIGTESDTHFNMMYDITQAWIQDTLIVESGEIKITIPGLDDVYTHRGMVYNVGAWLYTQLKYYNLGMLSDNRYNKLRKIDIVKRDYDSIGNVIATHISKFNALDKDSYVPDVYRSIIITHEDTERVLFAFDADGYYDIEGENKILLLDEDTYYESFTSSDKTIKHQAKIKNILFGENYLYFKNKEFYPEGESELSFIGISKMDNPDEDEITTYIFYHKPIEQAIGNFVNWNIDYLANEGLKILEKDEESVLTGIDAYSFDSVGNLVRIIKRIDAIISNEGFTHTPQPTEDYYLLNAEDQERLEYYQLLYECLDYVYTNELFYNENYEEAMAKLIRFNPLLLSDLYHSNIECTSYTGAEINEKLQHAGSLHGIYITRHKVENSESYIMVFEDGILIPEYSKMVVSPNSFYIPIEREFNPTSIIEVMCFNYINNNEISLEISEDIIDRMETHARINLPPEITKYIGNNPKIFCKYPEALIQYLTLVKESSHIAFEVSEKLYDGSTGIRLDIIDPAFENPDDTKYQFTAVSDRKFIYQRLHNKEKAYRFLLDTRFRYCNNQKQYKLFINGRLMDDDTFLITIPKGSRPFWGMYLYTRKFVDPGDRIELFYIPEELSNCNEDDSYVINNNATLSTQKQNIEAPLDSRYYLFWINGKKIPSSSLVQFDSHTLRMTRDMKTTNHLVVNKIYTDTISEVSDYLKGDTYSLYDSVIAYILNADHLSLKELDILFSTSGVISNTEINMLSRNVASIAIINEIVRDFWVSSGYDYSQEPFIYDFETDEFIYKDDNDNFIIPALDAAQYINIIKNDTHLLYYYHSPEENWYDLGTTITGITFYWDYSKNFYGMNNVKKQRFYYSFDDENERHVVELDLDKRTWVFNTTIDRDITFYFEAITLSEKITKTTHIKFDNGVYYGAVDEDSLQHYEHDPAYAWISGAFGKDLMALIPLNGVIPSYKEQNAESIEHLNATYDKINRVITELEYKTLAIVPAGESIFDEKYRVDIDHLRFTDIVADKTELTYNEDTGLANYFGTGDLEYLLGEITRSCQPTPELNLQEYILGNNKYFIYACPKKYAYDSNEHLLIEFFVPDLKEIKKKIKDDNKALPLYTSGNYSYTGSNLFESLDEYKVELLDTFVYTNEYGVSEVYCVWKSNGFFTRGMDEYPVSIKVKFKDSSRHIDYDLNDTIKEGE